MGELEAERPKAAPQPVTVEAEDLAGLDVDRQAHVRRVGRLVHRGQQGRTPGRAVVGGPAGRGVAVSGWDTGLSVPAWVPEDYPAPAPEPVTTWALRTPEGDPVGVLRWNDGGLTWTPADTEHAGAQAHALDETRRAYDGDLTES